MLFVKPAINSKRHDLTEFKDILELLYYDIEDIKPYKKYQEKDLEKRKVVINTASKLYDKRLTIYITQYDKLSEDKKKRINLCK